MLPALTPSQKNGALVALIVALVAVLIFTLMQPRQSFHKLPLSYELTMDKAMDLTLEQMNGTQPLQRLELNAGRATTEQFVPPTLRDIVLSMKEDAKHYKFDGICAMNYNIPVSVCMLPVFGSERNLVMYNLRMMGYSKNSSNAGETSLLCDRGRTKYGCDRFKFVWIEFWDEDLEFQFIKVADRMTRVVQHMAWLNQGYTVCDKLSAQKQADILFTVTSEYRPVNS